MFPIFMQIYIVLKGENASFVRRKCVKSASSGSKEISTNIGHAECVIKSKNC